MTAKIKTVHTVYQVSSRTRVHPMDPLHVGNFYKGKQRNHVALNDERQALILYLARIHQLACDSGIPRGFCEIPISLTHLRKWVYDYRPAFDYFFEVVSTGFNISAENKEVTTVIPRDLKEHTYGISSSVYEKDLTYKVPPLPDDGVVSKAYIQFENGEMIREKLKETKRFDLVAPVEYLLNHPTSEINFWFKPSGKLQLRDTSIWPIKGIETWPGWLRVALFGEGIDIESAYTQFLLTSIRDSGISQHRFEMLFPQLIASLKNKKEWRNGLCEKIGAEVTPENIDHIKTLCMSLANGAKVSGQIAVGFAEYSSVKEILADLLPDAKTEDVFKAGEYLKSISREYLSAKKLVCLYETGKYPSRENQKRVFRSYFQWEREARYAIWETVGRIGIMVHDGIDGIPQELCISATETLNSIGLRVD